MCTRWHTRRSRSHQRASFSVEAELPRLLLAERIRVQRDLLLLPKLRLLREQDRVALAGRADGARPTAGRMPARGRASGGCVRNVDRRHAGPVAELVRAPSAGTSCRQTIVGPVGGDEVDHLAQIVPAGPAASLPRKRFQARTSIGSTVGNVRVSSRIRRRSRPGTTTSLATALARAAALRWRWRRRASASPTLPPPAGYRRIERFYPALVALFRRSRARLPLKAVEHVGRAGVAGTRAARTCCTSSGSRCRRPTRTSASARRRCSRRTTCCRGGRPASATSGGGCSRASTASSSTASAAARCCRARRRGARDPASRSTRARQAAPTTGRPCSRSA